MAVTPHDKARDKEFSSCIRDHYGFEVNREFLSLHRRFSPLWAEEETERSALWATFFQECQGPGNSPEADTELLQDILSQYGTASGAAQPSAETAARLQQLRALVQAGVPMASRGKYWQLFLGVPAKRQPGLYEELVQFALSGEVEDESPRYAAEAQLGEAAAAAAGASPTKGGGKALAADGRPVLQGVGSLGLPVVELLADSSTAGAAARAAAGGAAAAGQAEVGMADGQAQWDGGRPNQHHTTLTVTIDSPELLEGIGESGSTEVAAATGAVEEEAEVGPIEANSQPEAAKDQLAGGSASPATPPAPPALSLEGGSSPCPCPCPCPASGNSSPAPSGADASPAASDGYASTAGSSGGAWSLGAGWRSKDWVGQIDKDLHRTFPGHPLMDGSGRAVLRRILAAYARHNPAVGYCQGMNFIAAAFMLFMGEEEAFWCLAAVVEDLLPGYFLSHMVAPQVDQQVFAHLLQGGFPTVWAHLQALEVDVSSVTMHWFLCMFINSLPLESCLRVWDMLFFEGSATVLFRVALALVDVYHKALLECRECSDAYMLLQSMGPMSFDSSRLLDTACIGYGHIRDSALRVLRNKYRPAILEQMRDSFGSDEELSEYERYFTAVDAVHSRSQAVAEAFARSPTGAAAAAAAPADSGHLTSGSSRGNSPDVSAKAAEEAQASAAASAATGAGVDQGGEGAGVGGRAGRPPSPLERLLSATQAVSSFTARLVPSSLPPLLPSGALDSRGQERVGEAQAAPPGLSLAFVPGLVGGLARGRAGGRSRRRSDGSQASGAEGEQQPSKGGTEGAQGQGPGVGEGLLRRITTLRRGTAGDDSRSSSSPAMEQSQSAASGAALARGGHMPHITPFSDPAVLGMGAASAGSGAGSPTTNGSPSHLQQEGRQQQQQQEEHGLEGGEEVKQLGASAASGSDRGTRTPLRALPRAPALAVGEPDPLDFRSPLRPSSLPAASSSRAPARAAHRRSISMLPPSSAALAADPRQRQHTRRKRSFLPDIHRLAQFIPDFAQPAVAAAYRIASNPSPRPPHRPDGARSPLSRTPLNAATRSCASSNGAAQPSEGAADEGCGTAALAAAAVEGRGPACDPVRVLRFGQEREREGESHSRGNADGDGSSSNSDEELSSQPGSAPATSPFVGGMLWEQELPCRRYTHGDACLEDSVPWRSQSEESTPLQALAPAPGVAAAEAAAAAAAGPEAAGRKGEALGGSGGSNTSRRSGASTSPAAASPPLGVQLPLETPMAAQRLLAQHPPTPNTGSQLLAVVDFLQQEVATTESRRHAAELAARQGSDTSQQLGRQLEKLERSNEEKERILADMNARVEALTSEVCELEGELCATRMAAQQLQQQVEQRQQQVAFQDELIRLLMDRASTL